MNFRLMFIGLAFVCMSATVNPAFAKKAELVLFPTRIILAGHDRTATVTLKNTGDATGQFTIDTLDMIMPENGAVTQATDGQTVEFSAKSMVRVSPRSISLAPGESQNIRILVRAPQGLEDGEYRTHMRVKMVNDNAEMQSDPSRPTIEIRAQLALVIPLIVRQGDTRFTATISEARRVNDANNPGLRLLLTREGNQSSMGDLKIVQEQNGKSVVVGELNGVPVYRPLPRRYVDIPFTSKPTGGPLKVIYQSQPKNGEKPIVFAETIVSSH